MYTCRLSSVNLIPKYLDMGPRSLASQSLFIALRSQSVAVFFAEAIVASGSKHGSRSFLTSWVINGI